jgi:hypothetical protein
MGYVIAGGGGSWLKAAGLYVLQFTRSSNRNILGKVHPCTGTELCTGRTVHWVVEV